MLKLFSYFKVLQDHDKVKLFVHLCNFPPHLLLTVHIVHPQVPQKLIRTYTGNIIIQLHKVQELQRKYTFLASQLSQLFFVW